MQSYRQSISNLIFLPFYLTLGILSKDFSRFDKILISFSPYINSINDCTGFHCRRFSFEHYGYWGYNPSFDGGINYGAMYAFLPNYLTWKLGLSGYMLFTIFIYGLFFSVFFFLSSMPYPWVLILVGMLAMYSPYFKNSAFVCSRHDVPGWVLLILGFWFITSGYLILSLVCLTLAFMMHPSISVAGTLYIISFTITGLIPPVYLLIFLAAQVFNIFWYVPFFKIFWKRMLSIHSWSRKKDDKTRSWNIHLKKMIGMLVFLACLLSVNPEIKAYIFAFVPFILFIISYWHEKYINRFAVELLWLCGAAAAYASTASLWLGLPYLFSLYFYASPAPRFHFPFKPLLIDKKKFYESFSSITEVLPNNSRVGVVFMFNTMEQYRMDAKYVFLLSAWLHSNKNRSIEYFMLYPDDDESLNDSKLSDFFKKYGIAYILTSSTYACALDGSKILKRVASAHVHSIGSVPGATFSLYKCLKEYPRIIPRGEILPHPINGLIVKCKPNVCYEIKYRPMPGLRVFQDREELRIEKKDAYSFCITSHTNSDIRIKFDFSKLWEV